MSNQLEPGFAGPAAGQEPSVNPPGVPQQAPSSMNAHFGSRQDQAKLRFDKIKEAAEQVQATQVALQRLAAFGDTVSMDDVVDAAADMVGAGVDPVQVAGTLADVPEQSAQIQAWVQQQLKNIAPHLAQAKAGLSKAGYEMGHAAMRHLIATSAADHMAKQQLSAAKPLGRA